MPSTARQETARVIRDHGGAYLLRLLGPQSACTEPGLLPDVACLGRIEATLARRGKTKLDPALPSLFPLPLPPGLSGIRPRPLERREGGSIGDATSSATQIAPESARIRAPKIWALSSTHILNRAGLGIFCVNENDQGGPMTAQDPFSPKCDTLGGDCGAIGWVFLLFDKAYEEIIIPFGAFAFEAHGVFCVGSAYEIVRDVFDGRGIDRSMSGA